MGETGALLSSLATSLDELTERVTDIADRYKGTAQDDVAHDLFEVERALRTAGRKLETVVRRLR